ncbi:MAG TPA: hypothetical protein VFT72_08260 [Opitutaceae bacterium]|nr:hypothetical protein [Opitutaceae bacterium]
MLPRSLISFFVFAALLSPVSAKERVYVDHGVLRWSNDNSEVALFGANYSLPSACDYRAPGYLGLDRKKLVEEDMAHFVRMGCTGVRLCFWGDWENSDNAGNLIANDHLDLLDYVIAEATRRNISILFTPITTYSSIWPDGHDSDEIQGFSKYYKKDRLRLDEAPIKAQQNYLKQLFTHINPYTHRALKDEPGIVFVELINEPTHHPENFEASVHYINALAEAVKGTGCEKVLFYNLSQDFAIAPAINASKAEGYTYAWYPTGLNSGHELKANFLRTVDHFGPMFDPVLEGRPRLVYEFDSADMSSGFMYPVMARAFRETGAQFMSMFSYDMLGTAPYNLGWQTHFLNLVASPRKALSAMIAAEVTRRVPRFKRFGGYPENTRFGPFHISYEQDLSEMVTDDTFLYSNSTSTAPSNPAKLTRIAGYGSSPVVKYSGLGAYFLDKIADGVWRLEIYPDAVEIADPFARTMKTDKPSIRLVEHAWPITIRLPDLGSTFSIARLDKTVEQVTAQDSRFNINAGVYLLTKEPRLDLTKLPDSVHGVGLREYYIPKLATDFIDIVPTTPEDIYSNRRQILAANVVTSGKVDSVHVEIRRQGETPVTRVSLKAAEAYRYSADWPDELEKPGAYEYALYVSEGGRSTRVPQDPAAFRPVKLHGRGEPLPLFNAEADTPKLSFTRIGDDIRHGIYKIAGEADHPPRLQLFLPFSKDANIDDYTAQNLVTERISALGSEARSFSGLRVRLRAHGKAQPVVVRLVEADGTGWSTTLKPDEKLKDYTVPLKELAIDKAAMLPLGYPGRWNYWMSPPSNRGGKADRLNIESVERIQFSLAPTSNRVATDEDPSVEIESASLIVSP